MKGNVGDIFFLVKRTGHKRENDFLIFQRIRSYKGCNSKPIASPTLGANVFNNL